MGFRFRKSFKIGPARMTFSKSGVSHSIGGKGFRITKTAKGKTRTTISPPGTGLLYTSESGRRKKKSSSKFSKSRNSAASYNTTKNASQIVKRPANPPKPPKSPKTYLICGVLLDIIGVLMIFLFWPLGLLFLGIGIYFITCGPKIYSKLVENYKAIHPEFEEN